MYVIEGACLGGQVIARALVQQLGIGQTNGAAFFTGDGLHTGVRWKEVRAWLAQCDSASGARHEIVAGACCTFAALSQWLAAREVLDE
jgi:heme oxygenase